MHLKKACFIPVDAKDRQPVLQAASITGERDIHLENAREVLGSLKVAPEPEEVLRRAGEEDVTQGPTCPLSHRPGRS